MDGEIFSRASFETLLRRVQERPDSGNDHFYLGIKFTEAKRFKEGLPHLVRARELVPDWYAPSLYEGECRYELGDLEGAEAALINARKLGAEYCFARMAAHYLGPIYEKLGRFGEAKEQFLDACKADPGSVWSHLALTRLCEIQESVRPKGWQNPKRDETFNYRSKAREARCRIRVFEHIAKKASVVLLTNDESSPGPGVVNSAEAAVEALSPFLEVSVSGTVWVTHFERTHPGIHALAEVQFGTIESHADTLKLSNARFIEMSPDNFRDITGYTICWPT